MLSCLGARNNNGLVRALLTLWDSTYPAPAVTRLSVVVATYCMQKAKAVEQGLARHRRFELLWFPTYCPRAHPLERVCGDLPDKGTRNHKRKRLRDLRQGVEWHVQEHGPWPYKLSHLYDAPEVTAAVEHIGTEQQPRMAACVYESRVARFRVASPS